MKVAIVDYGMGNICSISSALNFIGCDEVFLTNNHDRLLEADKIILPGVGNFSMASSRIEDLGLFSILDDVVLKNKKPILGICLGMQLIGLSSTEGKFSRGLGYVNGGCDRFIDKGLKIPHVGYNQVQINSDSRLFKGLSDNSDFYFTHSYRMTCDTEIGQSMCSYGTDFIASFELDHITGVQFHPELSQRNGLKLLKNFVDLF